MNTKQSPLQHFVENTYIKGVPRTFKSQGPIFRMLWGSSVIAGFSLATWFVVLIFGLYLSDRTVISINQVRDGGNNFPAITLCNLNPMANTDIMEKDVYELYHFLNSENFTWSTVDRQYLELLLSPASVFENLIYGRSNERTRNFIVSCRWNRGFLYDEDLCMENLERVVYVTTRGYCYTFRPPPESSNITSFSAIVYIGNSIDVLLPTYDMSIPTPYSSGALLALHNDGIPPNLREAIALEVGYDTDINFEKSRIFRVHECNDQKRDKQELYDRDNCIHVCTRNEIARTCGCIDGRISSVDGVIRGNNNLSFCNDVSPSNSSLRDFIARMKCLESITYLPSSCDAHCPEMCRTEDIATTTSKVPWPHPSYQLSLWSRYLRHVGHFDYFQAIEQLASTDPERAYRMLELVPPELRLTRNFLQVNQHNTRASIHLAVRRLTAKSREVSKPLDWML